jgi:hypothetical protein
MSSRMAKVLILSTPILSTMFVIFLMIQHLLTNLANPSGSHTLVPRHASLQTHYHVWRSLHNLGAHEHDIDLGHASRSWPIEEARDLSEHSNELISRDDDYMDLLIARSTNKLVAVAEKLLHVKTEP